MTQLEFFSLVGIADSGQDCTPPVYYMTPKQLGWVKQPPANAWRALTEKRKAHA